MSTWQPEADLAAEGTRPLADGNDPLAIPAGVAVGAIGLVLLMGQARFRIAEAGFSAWVLRLSHLLPAKSLGNDVVFPLHGKWVGFSLSVACTAALLLVPFFAAAGLLLASGRFDRRRVLIALAVVSAIIFAVNQLRLLVIAGSMVAWGFQTGYERSHIFIGTLLSTLGVIVGVIIFVWMLIDAPSNRRPARRAHG